MIVQPRTKPGLLLIGTCSSTCGGCGFDADPQEKAHTTRLGYDSGDGKGCGVTFTHVISTYHGNGAEEAVKKMRPDLTLGVPE